jgi:hypothetical protein
VPRRDTHLALSACAALALCAAFGGVVAVDPRAIVGVAAVSAAAAMCVLAYRRPRESLALAMFLVLVAATKTRNRDLQAAVGTSADGQILVELGLYGLIGLITVVVAFTPAFRRQRLVFREWVLAAFVAFALVSALWSDLPMLTMVRAVQLGLLFVLTIVAVRVLDVAGTVHALGAGLVAYVLLCSAVAVALPSTRITSGDGRTVALANERFSWFAMHSISCATFAAMAILYLSCVALFLPRGWRQWRAGLPVCVSIVPLCAVLVATSSRGPLLALVGALAALVALRLFRPVTSLASGALVVLLALAASIAGVTPTSAFEDAARSNSPVAALVLRGQDAREFSTLTGRTELWSIVIPLWLKRPIAGYGYQGSREVLLQRLPWAGHAHNALLQTLLDVGLVGALLLWIPFFTALVARPPSPASGAVVERWASASVFAALTFTLLNSVSDVGFAGPPGYEALLVFCSVVAAERLARRDMTAAQVARDRTRVVRTAWVAPSAHRT